MRSTMKTVTNNVKPKSGKPNKHQQFVLAAVAAAKVPKAPVDQAKKALKDAFKAAYVARKTGHVLDPAASALLLTAPVRADRTAARRNKYAVATD